MTYLFLSELVIYNAVKKNRIAPFMYHDNDKRHKTMKLFGALVFGIIASAFANKHFYLDKSLEDVLRNFELTFNYLLSFCKFKREREGLSQRGRGKQQMN